MWASFKEKSFYSNRYASLKHEILVNSDDISLDRVNCNCPTNSIHADLISISSPRSGYLKLDRNFSGNNILRRRLGRSIGFFITRHGEKQEKLEERYKNHVKPLIESLKLWFKRDIAGELRVVTDVRPTYTIDFGHAVYHTNDATVVSAPEDPTQVHDYAKQHLTHYPFWESWKQYKTQSETHLLKVKALWKQIEEIITNEIASKSLSVKPYEFSEPSMPKSWYSMRALVEYVHARLCEKRIYSLVPFQTQDGYWVLRDGAVPIAEPQGEDETLSLKQIVEQLTVNPKIVEQYKLLEDEKQSLKLILTTFEDGLRKIEEDFDLNGVLLKPDCNGCKDWHPKLS
jgi:hypothetical protein